MRFLFTIIFSFLIAISYYAQVLPTSRSVDWTLAGLRDAITSGFQVINMQSTGAIGAGITPNNSTLSVQIETIDWITGVYFITVELLNNNSVIKKVIRVE